jgi:hypothetical protein
MKIEIELHELKNVGFLHQEGFDMTDGITKKNYLSFCTTVPGGLPYIFIHEGRHAGKAFIVKKASMIDALHATFFAKPAATQ